MFHTKLNKIESVKKYLWVNKNENNREEFELQKAIWEKSGQIYENFRLAQTI